MCVEVDSRKTFSLERDKEVKAICTGPGMIRQRRTGLDYGGEGSVAGAVVI